MYEIESICHSHVFRIGIKFKAKHYHRFTSIDSSVDEIPRQSIFSKCSSTDTTGFRGSDPARNPFGYPRWLVFRYNSFCPLSINANLRKTNENQLFLTKYYHFLALTLVELESNSIPSRRYINSSPSIRLAMQYRRPARFRHAASTTLVPYSPAHDAEIDLSRHHVADYRTGGSNATAQRTVTLPWTL